MQRRFAPAAAGPFAAGALALAALAGCGSTTATANPQQELQLARTTIDSTGALHFSLTSRGATGSGAMILGGSGDAARPDSLSGTFEVAVSGLPVTVKVVGVAGRFYVEAPFTTGFTQADPTTYGIGDPAQLIDPTHGLSSVLPALTSVRSVGRTRIGSEIADQITGTIPGHALPVLPDVAPAQPVTVTVDVIPSSHQIREMVLTGPFTSATPAAAGRVRWQLAVASAAVLLAAADTYVVVVALPSIMAGVGIGLDQLQRATPVISGFLLGYVAVLPLLGRLSDLAGRRPVLLGCLVTFGLGSLVTATAHSLAVLVAGRALQGLGGGGLVPVTLSLVAASWPVERRGLPLGVVGAVQELGSVLGPLWGAAVVAAASWRAIFWVNLPLAAGLAIAFAAVSRRRPDEPAPALHHGRADVVGSALAVAGLALVGVGLWAPSSLADSVTWGSWVTPRLGGATWVGLSDPATLIGLGLLVAFVLWEALAPGVRRLVDPRRLPALLRGADLPGATLLAGVLACVVIAFSTADPSRQIVSSSAPVLAPVAAVLLVAFVVRQRRARVPLLEPGALSARPAWGALLVNLALGAGLMAALIDVPFFARATRYPASELGAALELVRFLVTVPVGALLGGAALRRPGTAPAVAATGGGLAAAAFVAMAGWGPAALSGPASTVELVACGLGFGLAIAPVNASVLASVEAHLHGLASALAVVARTIGMLAGLSALTAVGLRRFYEAQARIGSPLRLCPTHPTSCPAYDSATTAALLRELHTIFAGAAGCCGAAAVLAAVLLRPTAPRAGRAPASAGEALATR